jgi:His/Glu/Gln/Arg/opine family amino acid ABC transporter permease subunit
MIDQIIPLVITMGPLLFKGLCMTIFLWLGSALLAFILGVPLGIFNSNQLKTSKSAWIMSSYIFIVRSIPVYVHVLITYFVLPDLLRINISPVCAAILALGICSSGYVAEIIRAGVNALPIGQWNACFVMGYSRWQSLRYILIPQMIYNVLPALFNELESLIKSTSILAAIGVVELTKVGTNIVARTMNPMPVYLLLALLYLLLSAALRTIAIFIERRSIC